MSARPLPARPTPKPTVRPCAACTRGPARKLPGRRKIQAGAVRGAALDVISHRGPDDSGWALFSGTGSVSTDHTGTSGRTWPSGSGDCRSSIYRRRHQPAHAIRRVDIGSPSTVRSTTTPSVRNSRRGRAVCFPLDTEVCSACWHATVLPPFRGWMACCVLMLIDTVERRLFHARSLWHQTSLHMEPPAAGWPLPREQFSAPGRLEPRGRRTFYDFLLRGVLTTQMQRCSPGWNSCRGHFATVGFGPALPKHW